MHILVATDGHLDADKATGLIARFHQSGDAVTLLTAVDHPREFLGDYASFTGVDEVAKIATRPALVSSAWPVAPRRPSG